MSKFLLYKFQMLVMTKLLIKNEKAVNERQDVIQ